MTDYSQLQSDIVSWSARSDVAAVTPSFIRLAEAFINRRVRVLEQEQDISLEFSSGNSYTADVPEGFLAIRSLVNPDASNPDCIYMPPGEFDVASRLPRDAFQTIRASEGTPYTITSASFKILAPVGAAEPVTLVGSAYIRFAALSESNTTNFLLTNHYDLYLFASLRELWDWADDERQTKKYENRALAIIEELEEEEHGKKRGAAPLRRRPPAGAVV